jgi:hypothetical protein
MCGQSHAYGDLFWRIPGFEPVERSLNRTGAASKVKASAPKATVMSAIILNEREPSGAFVVAAGSFHGGVEGSPVGVEPLAP